MATSPFSASETMLIKVGILGGIGIFAYSWLSGKGLGNVLGEAAGDVVVGVIDGGVKVVKDIGTRLGIDWDKLDCMGIGVPVQLETCPHGWVTDPLTCRKPIEWKNGKLTGGQVRGRLDHGGTCPKTNPTYKAGLCYRKCKRDDKGRWYYEGTQGIPGIPA